MCRLTLHILVAVFTSLVLTPHSTVAGDKLLPVIHFERLTDVDLPSWQIRSRIARDHQGFIWIGTLEGLARFDGHTCRVYRNRASDPHSLPANIVNGLHVDRDNRLWVGCWGAGLSLFDPDRERFVHFRSRKNDTAWIQTSSIVEIFEDRAGHLWLGSVDGEIVLVDLSAARKATHIDSVARRIRFRSLVYAGFKSFIYGIEDWDEHSVLVSSNGGLFIIDRATGKISRPNLPPVSGVRIDTVMTTGLCWANPDRLWIGTAFHGLYSFSRSTGSLVGYHKRPSDGSRSRDDRMTDVQVDRNGRLWIATLEGIDLFDPSSGMYREYLRRTAAEARSIYTRFAIDNAGILWVSTYDKGVFFLHPRSFRLPHLALRGNTGRPMPMEMIDQWKDGSLWITGDRKVFEIDPGSLEVNQIVDLYPEREDIPFGRAVADSYNDGKRRIWYGTFGVGLYSLEPATGRVKNYRPPLRTDRSKQKFYSCQGVADAGGDSLWVAMEYDGVYKFDPRTGKFSKIFDCWAYRLMKDSRGKVWISDDQEGVRILDLGTNAFVSYVHDDKDPTSLSGNKVIKTMEDTRGRIWVGAATLDLWEPATRSFKHFPNPAVREGTIGEPLGSDARGRIWVSYLSDVLGILDPTTGSYTNFDYSDGACGMTLPADLHHLLDGRVVLTGYAGLNVVHPDSLVSPQGVPPFVLTRVTVNDTGDVSPHSIGSASGLQLSSWQNVLEFEFAVIDPGATHLAEYLYRLEGLEDTWLHWNERRFVRYPGLNAGEYVFRVKARNMHGDWPEQEIALAISIAPPWWRTWGAYATYAVLALGLFYGAFRVRLRQVRLKHWAEMEHVEAEHLAEVDKLKSRFFANISHEFRTPLTLILGPAGQLLETSSDDKTVAAADVIWRSAKKLNRLVDELLDISRIEAGEMRLRASPVNVVALVGEITLSFQPQAERRHIRLSLETERDEISAYLDREKVDKILSNVLSNAFKFTPAGGRVDVVIGTRGGESAEASRSVEIAVRDTGIGIPREELERIFDRFYQVDGSHTREGEGTGIGLSLCKELMTLHKGRIEVESEEGKGSTFRLVFPLGTEHLAPEEIVEETSVRPLTHAQTASVEEVGAWREQTGQEDETNGTPGRPSVLVVEDNSGVRRYIGSLLERDYRVCEAEDGLAGFASACKRMPDLIICDIMMPKLDGLELCRRLKEECSTSHIPVIMLTAKATMQDRINGLTIGADDYLVKPFDAGELKARIRNLLEQRKRLWEHFRLHGFDHPEAVSLAPVDRRFLERVQEIIAGHLADPLFGVEVLASEMAVSRSLLFKKMHALVGESPSGLIRRMRLQHAARLIGAGEGNISEIALEVGFSNPSYFAECFRKEYGVLPSHYHGPVVPPGPS